MSKIAIIIPIFNEGDKLKKCLAAIENQQYKNVTIYIRDNNQDNILFTAAINEGIRKYYLDTDVDFVLLLNQDAYLKENTLATLVKFMQENPKCGIASPVQIAENGRVTWAGSLQAFPFDVHNCDPSVLSKPPSETYWANGACMLVRMHAIREIGLLDQNMRFICSDGDYSFTMRSRNWKVYVVPNAVVQHALEGSGANTNVWLNTVKLQDAYYFAKKWLNGQLYKELSYEGPKLTRLGIKSAIEKFERALASPSKN